MDLQGIFQQCFDPATNTLRVSGSGDAVFIWPNAFTIQAGTPAVINTDVPGWLFDAAADEAIHTSIMLPSLWGIVNVDYLWSNEGAGAGNVRWVADLKTLSATNLTTEAVVTTGATSTAGAQNAVVIASDVISQLSVGPNDLYVLRVRRDADDAADTLANDARLLGVRIRRAI